MCVVAGYIHHRRGSYSLSMAGDSDGSAYLRVERERTNERRRKTERGGGEMSSLFFSLEEKNEICLDATAATRSTTGETHWFRCRLSVRTWSLFMFIRFQDRPIKDQHVFSFISCSLFLFPQFVWFVILRTKCVFLSSLSRVESFPVIFRPLFYPFFSLSLPIKRWHPPW